MQKEETETSMEKKNDVILGTENLKVHQERIERSMEKTEDR